MTSAEGRTWLMEAAKRCAQGQYPDPCQLISRRGRPRGPQAIDSLEAFRDEILQWMRACVRHGRTVEELREEDFVRHRWPDHYGDNALPEGEYAYLARAMLDRRSPARTRKRPMESGVRRLRGYLERLDTTWDDLKQVVRTER